MKSDNLENLEKIENETPTPEPKSDVSGNDQIIVNVTSDPVDLSGIESDIQDLHYQQTEIISQLQDIADRPTITPSILYSVLIIAIVMFILFQKK